MECPWWDQCHYKRDPSELPCPFYCVWCSVQVPFSRNRTFPNTESFSVMILDFAVSRIIRSKRLLVKSHYSNLDGLWYCFKILDNSNIYFLSTFWCLFLFNSQFCLFLVWQIILYSGYCYKTLQHIQNIWYYLFFSDTVVTKEVGECHFIIARCGIKVQVSHSASVDTSWGKGLFIIQCQSGSSGFPLDLHG